MSQPKHPHCICVCVSQPSAAALEQTEKILGGGGGGGFYAERTLEKQHVAAAAELFMTRVETEGSRG